MKIVLKTAAILMLLLVVAVAVAWFGFLRPQPPPISPEDRSRLTLMPLPAALELGEGAFVLGGSLSPGSGAQRNAYLGFHPGRDLPR